MKLDWRKVAAQAVVTALAVAAGSAFAADLKEIRFGVEASYVPFEYKTPDGKLTGFDIDVGNAVCAKLKAKCVWVENDFDGLIPALQARKFDAINSDMTITDQRKHAIDFTDPIYTIPNQLIAKKGSTVQPTVDGLRKQLKGKTIGIQSGTVYTKFINDGFKDIATIRVYKTSPERDLDLANGRIDASFDDVTYYAANADKKESAQISMAGPKIGGPIWGPGEGLAFRKQDADLKAKFDTAIADALKDGTVKKLSDKWFKTDVTP